MKILYICTHNRCRSILCEAITNNMSGGRIIARSAGSQPQGEVHPLTLQHLERNGFGIDGLRSKSWDELEEFEPNLIITVCDSAANEACPVWFGRGVKMHWGLNDPSNVEGDQTAVNDAFQRTIAIIQDRVDLLLNLPLETLDDQTLDHEVRALKSLTF